MLCCLSYHLHQQADEGAHPSREPIRPRLKHNKPIEKATRAGRKHTSLEDGS
ncbi:hypothetical protein EI42_03082, partial [Thermosporothrix hazakensis]